MVRQNCQIYWVWRRRNWRWRKVGPDVFEERRTVMFRARMKHAALEATDSIFQVGTEWCKFMLKTADHACSASTHKVFSFHLFQSGQSNLDAERFIKCQNSSDFPCVKYASGLMNVTVPLAGLVFKSGRSTSCSGTFWCGQRLLDTGCQTVQCPSGVLDQSGSRLRFLVRCPTYWLEQVIDSFRGMTKNVGVVLFEVCCKFVHAALATSQKNV